MKQLFFGLLLLLSASLRAEAQGLPGAWGDQGNGTYINPILAADYSDPDVIRVGEKYYMVASDFHFMGMQVLESSDLVNWRLIAQLYDRFEFEGWTTNDRYAGGSWAPAIRYHDGKFWVFFCTPDEGLFMTTATDPAGPWAPLHLVERVEKWEDPCPFWDEDGNAYLGRSRHGAGPIIIHKMSPDGRRLLDEGVTVYRGPVAEGTKIHKWNGLYYLSIPEGGVGSGWQTVLRSESIYGPYERRIVLERGSTPINGPHQGSIIDLPDGRWAFLHFQHDGALGRVTHLQPMRWQDGWPVIGEDYDRNGIGEPVKVGIKPLPSSEIYAPATDDDFADKTLGLQWQFNHNPVDGAWSLNENPGFLTLDALPAENFQKARNTLSQKIMGFESEATVALDLRLMAEGQRCGLGCMGKSYQTLGVKREGGKNILYHSDDVTEEPICTLEGHNLYLRVAIEMPSGDFAWSYSTNNRDFTPCGEPFKVAFGNWKGARLALYSFNKGAQGGKALFNWFRYRHDGPQAAPQSPAEKIVASIRRTSFPDRSVTIRPLSKADDKAGKSRTLLQRAIDSLSQAGGGRVVVEAGSYFLPGNLVLKSDIDLHLKRGATLLFSGRADDFLPEVLTRWEGTELYGHSPMIYAYHTHNVAITGEGTIDAQGGLEFAPWAAKEAPDRDRLREMGEKVVPLHERVFGKGTILRPSCIQFLGCTQILVEGVTILNSPFWTIHPVYCSDVVVRGVTIDSHYPNNDGCDPESTCNVLIEHCTFRTGDDAIAIKAGRDADGRSVGRTSKNIVIRDCFFHSECNGLCIGSEMSGGVENVYMDNIEIGTVKNAIYFKSNLDRGGFIRNVRVSNITVERAKGAILRFESNYFGFRGGNFPAQYSDFEIRHVLAQKADNYAIFMDGLPATPIRDIEIEDFHVREAKHPHYLYHTERIWFKDCTVNGRAVALQPKESKHRQTCDVW